MVIVECGGTRQNGSAIAVGCSILSLHSQSRGSATPDSWWIARDAEFHQCSFWQMVLTFAHVALQNVHGPQNVGHKWIARQCARASSPFLTPDNPADNHIIRGKHRDNYLRSAKKEMTLHRRNNDLLTHIGADYLRCDIFDFGEREIRPGEVESVEYTARRIRFGGLPTVATVVLAVLIWAFIVGLQEDRIDFEGAIGFAGMGGLFVFYLLQRLLHCTRNNRRVITLTLTDGTTGTLIELEDDRSFSEARSVIDEYVQNQRGEPDPLTPYLVEAGPDLTVFWRVKVMAIGSWAGYLGRSARKMIRTSIARWIRRVVLVVALGTSVFLAVAFMPGSIEGNYRGGMDCMCDSWNFLRYSNGRVVLYESNHPPAFYVGPYEKCPDGSIRVFFQPSESERSQELYRAYPRLLVTKFVSVNDGSVSWLWKRPLVGKTKLTVMNHEIESTAIHADRMVRTFYNNEFEVLRRETIPLGNDEAEQAEPSD